MKTTRDHAAYDSCLQNVMEAAGYAHDHLNVRNLPLCPSDEEGRLEAEAEEQAKEIIECGECCCCSEGN